MRIYLTLLALVAIGQIWAGGKQNPGLNLNPQDVPVFSEDNPLTGMKAFTVLKPLGFNDDPSRDLVDKAIEAELGAIGEVIHLKDNDMVGFGAGNVLVVQIGKVRGWDGKEMPLSRISLQVETSALLNKTGIKTFPAVWSINGFFQDSSGMAKATEKLIKEFALNYQYANSREKKRPTFYIYD